MDELRNDQIENEELERYGVWVKAGPEEVVEAEEDFALSDLSDGSEESPLDDTESLSAASQDLDVDVPAGELPDLDEFEDITLDDLDFSEDEEFPTTGQDAPSTEDAAPSLSDGSDELTIRDASPETTDTWSESATASDDESEEEEDLISLDDFDVEVPEEDPDPFQTLPAESEEGGAEQFDSDEIEASPMETVPAQESLDESGSDFDLDDLEAELPDDFEELDMDTSDQREAEELEPEDFDSSIPGSDSELDDLSLDDISVEDSAEELPELEEDSIDESGHDFTPEDQGIDIETITPSNTISPDEEEFLNDESDLQNEPESAIPASMDLQEREAFERIQTELADIKKELAELKAALRGAGTSAEPAASETARPTDDVELTAATAEALEDEGVSPEFTDSDQSLEAEADAESSLTGGTGFFEDEEDETIALTGDELDNILNTAEFTEQAGEAVELEDDFIVEPDTSASVTTEPEAETTEDDLTSRDSEETEETDHDVDSIELEPVSRDSVVFEGDESAVDELAEMDIDSELADIDSLEDDTDDASDDLEIDLEGLEDVDTSGVLEEHADTAAEERAAEMDQQALESDSSNLDDLEIDDLDFDSDETTEDESVDVGETADETEADETEADELEADELEADEPEADETEADELEADEDAGAEGPEPDELEVSSEDSAEDEGFDDFAAAVEEDIASADGGVDLDQRFDEPAEPSEPEDDSTASDASYEDEEQGEIEIELDDIDGIDDFEDYQEPAVADESLPPDQTTQPEADHPAEQSAASISDLPDDLKQEIRSVLSYMDQLLEALPDDKIEEFAHSEHFEVYKRLFEELGLET